MSKRTLQILPCILCFIGSFAQSPVIRVDDVTEYKRSLRETKLALERALIINDPDSISYWRSAVIVIGSGQRPDTIPLLDDQERTLLNFATSDHPEILRDIDDKQHFYQSRERRPYSKYPGEIYILPSWYTSPSLTYGLRDFWLLRSDAILDSLHRSRLTSTDREFLSLYWMAAINSLYNFPIDTIFNQEDIDHRSNTLLSSDPSYHYAPVVKAHIRRQFKLTRTGVGFAFLGGPNLMLGDLEPHFMNATNFGINVDVTYQRLMFRFHALGLDSRLRTDLLVDSAIWHGSELVSGATFGGTVGWIMLDKPLGRLITSAGLQTTKLIYTVDEEDRLETPSFVQPIVELMYDLKLNFLKPSKDHMAQRTLWTRKEEAYWLMRLRAGFAPAGYGPGITPQGSIIYFSIGIGGYWRPVTLDKD